MIQLINAACKCDPALCPNECGCSYKGKQRKNHLKEHINYACGISPQFQCEICFRTFSYKTSLKGHVQYSPSNSKINTTLFLIQV